MPYLMGAPFSSGFTTILDIDFTTWSLGFLSNTAMHSQPYHAPVKSNLTFNRNYTPGGSGYSTPNGSLGETVQTSPSTLLRSSQTTQTDIACIGNRSSSKSNQGIVIQHSIWNFLGSSANAFCRDKTLWTTGSGVTTTYPFADSPDGSGTGCSEEDVNLNGFGNYSSVIPAGAGSFPFTLSAWQRSVNAASNGEMWIGLVNNTPGNTAHVKTTPASNTWGRNFIYNASVAGDLARTCDGQTWPGTGSGSTGSSTGQHRTCLVDYMQFEPGSWPSEAIPTPNSVRPYDQLQYSSPAALVANTGQFKFYAKFIPKFASTDSVTFMQNIGATGSLQKWYIWSQNGGVSYAYVDATTKKIHVKLGGTTGELTSTNAIAWSQYDQVEIYIAVGGNVASKLKYRVNGGSWTDLVLGTIVDTPSFGSGNLGFFYNNGGSEIGANGPNLSPASLPCWLNRITVYKGNSQPVGV